MSNLHQFHEAKFKILSEKEFQKSQELQLQFLEKLLSHAHVCIAVMKGLELRYTLVNPAYQALRPDVEILGKTYTEVFPDAAKTGSDAIIQKVIETGEPHIDYGYDIPIPGKPDAAWDHKIIRLPVVEDDEPSALVITWDATEHKRTQRALETSEKRYREVVQYANSAIIRWKCDGTIIFFNEYAQNFFGYRSAEIIGENITIIVPPQDSVGLDLTNLVQDIITNPQNFTNHINENICRNGQRVWMTWTNKPIYNEKGEVVEILAVGSDITKQKQAEDALHKLNESLEEQVLERTNDLERQNDRLRWLANQLTNAEHRERLHLAKILHDGLQQLLIATSMQLKKYQKKPSPEVYKNLEKLINDSIATSRSLSHELSPPILYKAGLTESLQWLCNWFQTNQDFNVDLNINGQLPFINNEIKIFLFNALRELLQNSVKHSGVNSASVSIQFNKPNKLHLTVIDNGNGFDPTRLDNEKENTHGLGLISIRERLFALNGLLEINSKPGEGARFDFYMPIEEVKGKALNEKVIYDQLKATKERIKGTKNILVVDDHKVVREGLISTFEDFSDLNVVGEASDGIEAIQKTEELQPDIILMDIDMPRMNGIEAIKHIKHHYPQIQIIGLSFHEKEYMADAVCKAGASAYLCKQNDLEIIVNTIYDLC